MKNKFITFLLIFFIVSNLSKASEFKFMTSEIKILDEGNYIEAFNGKAVSKLKFKQKNLNIKKIYKY